MKVTLRTSLVMAATLIVIVIGVAMFATAGQPMSAEAEIAQTWVNALCAGRIDDLYALSAVPETLDKAAFGQQVSDYLSSGAIPQPCAGQVNLNLIRSLAVPKGLIGTVDRVRYFDEVILRGDNGQSETIALWLYHRPGGAWRVWASFLGATLEPPVAAGGVASLLNSNGVLLGSIQIKAPITVYQTEGQALIGIPVDVQVLSTPLEYYEAQLFVDQARVKAVDNVDLLPKEWQTDFLAPVGGYVPQNLHQTGRLWFRADTLTKPMVLAFTVRVPYSGTLQAAYLDVPLATAVQATPFNPFKRTNLRGGSDVNAVFDLQIDTTGLPSDRFSVICSDFVLVLTTDEWKRATDCSFGGQQDFLPGEQQRATVTFAGYNLSGVEQLKVLTYRRGEDWQLIRYTLWQP